MQKSTHIGLSSIFICFLAFISGCSNAVLPSISVPTIASVTTSPNSDGSVTVQLTGTGFVNGSSVTVDGYACTSVHVISSTQLTCILPSADIPLTNIVITNPGGGGSSPGTNATHMIFVTSSVWGGNALGGLEGADSKCVTLAAKGSTTKNLAGTWRAILSDATHNAKDRISFVSGSSIITKYTKLNGGFQQSHTGFTTDTQGVPTPGNPSLVTYAETVVENSSDLWSSSLENPIQFDENGYKITTYTGAWTGSTSGGLSYNDTAQLASCYNWSSSAGITQSGVLGDITSVGSTWLEGTMRMNCSGGSIYSYRLYCINSNN